MNNDKSHDITPIKYDEDKNKRIEDILNNAISDHIRQYEVTLKEVDYSLYEYVMEKSYKMNKFNPKFKNRVKFVLDKMQEIPLCPICGKEVDIGHCKSSRRFIKYCSIECRNSDPKSRTLDQNKYFKKTGYRHPMNNPDVTDAMKKRYREKTGYDFSTQNPDVVKKMNKSNIEKYGVPYASMNNVISSKGKVTTRLNKYSIMLNDDKIIPLFTFEEFLNFNREKDVLRWKCKKCGKEFTQKLQHGKSKISGTYAVCPECFKNVSTSYEENALYEFILKVCPYKVQRNRLVLKSDKGYRHNLEIDIYIPELKLGFEYDGLYFHQTKQKGRYYHLNKTKMAERQGIRLVHIKSSDIKRNPISWLIMIYKMVNNNFNILDEIKNTDDKTLLFERGLINKCWKVPGYTLVLETEPLERKLRSEGTRVYSYSDCGFLVYRKNEFLDTVPLFK